MTIHIDLGCDHTLSFVAYMDDPRTGANVYHKNKEGGECIGWIPFTNRAWAKEFNSKIATWDVGSWEPLTVTPSLLCRACGDHGFITNGKWVRV